MRKQIVVIHGGRTYTAYQDYIDSLKNREVTIDNFKTQKEWKESLQADLGPDFEVFSPKMPNGNNAVYQEWKIWLERLVPFLQDNSILIGHSLGGIFLAKYLSENVFPKKIKAVILLAAPFSDEGLHESLGGFALPPSLERFSEQVGNIYLLASEDDPVVPYTHLEKYKKALPNSKEITFTGKQHCREESFPEMIDLIKSL
ncbi:alpha/beta hydrolase [Candidatus Parcubacteria bacterium]|nr:alpha/beta hydrolase [Candidatus Parcubacteria bacterium]